MAEEIIAEFGDEVSTISLVKGNGGRFEVSMDGTPVFSKSELHRHAAPGEISDLIREFQVAGGSAKVGSSG